MSKTLLSIGLIKEDGKHGLQVSLGLPDFVDPDSKEVQELRDDVEKLVHKLGNILGADSLEKEEVKHEKEIDKVISDAKVFGQLAKTLKKVAPETTTDEQRKMLDEMELFGEIADLIERFSN